MVDENITVNAEEVAKVEQEIDQKEAAQKANTEKAVEEKVRAEMKQESELSALKAELAAKEAAVQELTKSQEQARAENDKLVQAEVAKRVEQEMATTKAQRTAVNPLNVQAPPQEFHVGEADVETIEKASMEAFLDRTSGSPRDR